MRRDWRAARAKLASEGHCRACGNAFSLQCAHIIPRSQVTIGGEDERNIIILCVDCHSAQHAGSLELLPLLTLSEQAYAVELVGIAEAYRRTSTKEIA